VGDLYDSVTIGGLRDKAVLMAKPFGGGIGNIALYAAAAEGTFWKFFRALRKKRGAIKEEKDLLRFADSIGIASAAFRKRLKQPETAKLLTAAREEGKRNRIKYTPTFFINGKRYRSNKLAHWITDAVLFEIEKQ
jgi:protein-disulfide isomerase